ncbi:unnamed protein product [Protopolystoma xenopodis]|uniref:Uncharacterized protein n=1 Tax=Protopolystoma xenopodis TaxID=117903 RepID=A0A448WS51_9PLAT|nr:unnamed protein product [Protopolystoma xenopodis]
MPVGTAVTVARTTAFAGCIAVIVVEAKAGAVSGSVAYHSRLHQIATASLRHPGQAPKNLYAIFAGPDHGIRCAIGWLDMYSHDPQQEK